jgi:hypothetical protein
VHCLWVGVAMAGLNATMAAQAQAQAQSRPTDSPTLWRGAYAKAEAQAWSNGVPVLALDGPWAQGYQPRAGTQRAYQSMRLESGVVLEPVAGWVMDVGAVVRAEAFARLSGDAAQALYHYQSQTDPATARSFDIEAQSVGWRGQGLQWGLSHADSPWGGWRMSFQYMSLARLRTTSTSGSVAYDGSGAYTYRVGLTDNHDQKRSSLIGAGDKTGEGMSVSLGWHGSPTTHLVLEVQLDDVWSSLRWDDLLGDDAQLNNTVVRTPDGVIDYQPALMGQLRHRAVLARIPMTATASATWQADQGQWQLTWRQRWGLTQTWVGWQANGPWAWSVAVEPRSGSTALGLQWAGLQAKVASNRTDQAAHSRVLSLAWSWPAP